MILSILLVGMGGGQEPVIHSQPTIRDYGNQVALSQVSHLYEATQDHSCTWKLLRAALVQNVVLLLDTVTHHTSHM